MPKVLTQDKQRTQYHLNGQAEALQFEQQVTAPCRSDPAAFTDYEEIDDPRVFEAQVACAACPFLENCADRARLERPAWGIWAGSVWDGSDRDDGYGRIVRRMRPKQFQAYLRSTSGVNLTGAR